MMDRSFFYFFLLKEAQTDWTLKSGLPRVVEAKSFTEEFQVLGNCLSAALWGDDTRFEEAFKQYRLCSDRAAPGVASHSASFREDANPARRGGGAGRDKERNKQVK